jgi:hypothetical protein
MTPATSTGMVSLLGADPAAYAPHPVHAADRVYPETNCYADVLIELLHARGHEPLAALGALVRMDFEGDQWTFFKPATGDVERLYGVDIHEMQPARDLPGQIGRLLTAGRTATVELDSWFLPDTAATSYRTEHVKTTVIPEAIDRDAEMLRYFHNAGYYELRGADYRGVFRLDGEVGGSESVAILPPYTELVRFDAGPALRGDALREATRELLARHLALRPADNPFARFGAALERDLPALLAGEPADYHAYAFATVRMVGSGFELVGAQARWLLGGAAEDAAAACDRIVAASKLLSLKLARRRPFDPSPVLAGMAEAWEHAVGGLDAALA